MAVYNGGKLSVNRYWKLRDREHTDSLSDTIEKVRFLVQDAIRRQMVSDVPIGTFLSGGLDSSIITSSNVGGFGIDGALSTLLGQSVADEEGSGSAQGGGFLCAGGGEEGDQSGPQKDPSAECRQVL